MTVRHAWIAALAAVSLTGCPASSDCDPLDEEFSIDEALSDERLDKIVSDYGLPDRDAITCNTACTVAYRVSRGWDGGAIGTCTFPYWLCGMLTIDMIA